MSRQSTYQDQSSEGQQGQRQYGQQSQRQFGQGQFGQGHQSQSGRGGIALIEPIQAGQEQFSQQGSQTQQRPAGAFGQQSQTQGRWQASNSASNTEILRTTRQQLQDARRQSHYQHENASYELGRLNKAVAEVDVIQRLEVQGKLQPDDFIASQCAKMADILDQSGGEMDAKKWRQAAEQRGVIAPNACIYAMETQGQVERRQDPITDDKAPVIRYRLSEQLQQQMQQGQQDQGQQRQQRQGSSQQGVQVGA